MAPALPMLMTIGGTALSAASTMKAADTNAGYLNFEGQQAAEAYNQNYAAQLRKNAVWMGQSTAAAVQGSGGVGGSTKGVLDQSQLNANLDALNIKYGGIIRKYTYDQQADIDRQQGRDMATAIILKGLMSSYTSFSNMTPPTPSASASGSNSGN